MLVLRSTASMDPVLRNRARLAVPHGQLEKCRICTACMPGYLVIIGERLCEQYSRANRDPTVYRSNGNVDEMEPRQFVGKRKIVITSRRVA